MIKRVLLTIAAAIVVLGLSTGYFYHVGKVERLNRNQFVCEAINIAVHDSATNKIITSGQIRAILGESYIGMPVASINLNAIENTLDSLGEVLSCEVYATCNSLEIRVQPRTATVRFITDGGHHYYCDSTGFIFPVESSVSTPVVTGRIPLKCGKNFKGYSNDPQERKWLKEIIGLTSFIEQDDYWKELTSHLNINEKGDIELYPTKGAIRFILGQADDKERKFEKVELWYKAIAPQEKASDYTEVILKYDNQIICK